tara:strand:+ start:71 stop:805 length:735 start_codon:yes stop_codon:yes gene_type:complete
LTSKKLLILIVTFLIFVFIYNNNLIRKFYNILTVKHDIRLSKNGGYCSGSSIGYLKYLKKKYNFNFNPRVINYENSAANSNWAVYDNNFKDKDSHIILLNYPKTNFILFKRKGRIFISTDTANHQNGILEILFDLKLNQINLNSQIVIYRKRSTDNNDKEIIYKDYLNETIVANVPISINYKTEKINNIYKLIYIEIPGLTEKQISQINTITLNLEHKYNLEKLKIIDSHNHDTGDAKCLYTYE